VLQVGLPELADELIEQEYLEQRDDLLELLFDLQKREESVILNARDSG
jgi:hypothetical protein